MTIKAISINTYALFVSFSKFLKSVAPPYLSFNQRVTLPFLLFCGAEVKEADTDAMEAETMGEVTSWSWVTCSIIMAYDKSVSVARQTLGIAKGRVVLHLDP